MDAEFAEATNVQALEATIVALELKPEHAALVRHARTIARSLDVRDEPDLKLHTEYRHLLTELLEVGKGEELDEYARLMAAISAGSKD